MTPDFSRETKLAVKGYRAIAGLDEVGRGCWAGPVVAAAVIVPPEVASQLTEVRDSKILSAKRRVELTVKIKSLCEWGIGICDNQVIDEIGIVAATAKAMEMALLELNQPADYLLIDGREKLSGNWPQLSIVEGDAICLSIAAASIIAKTYRDNLMTQYETEYPNYGFAKHVGYGTKIHRLSLAEYGPCAIHRNSFKPVKNSKSTKNMVY